MGRGIIVSNAEVFNNFLKYTIVQIGSTTWLAGLKCKVTHLEFDKKRKKGHSY